MADPKYGQAKAGMYIQYLKMAEIHSRSSIKDSQFQVSYLDLIFLMEEGKSTTP
jgi:hypothetical protein